MSHFPETPCVLKVELGLDDCRRHVDFPFFNSITPSFRVRRCGSGEFVDLACPSLSVMSYVNPPPFFSSCRVSMRLLFRFGCPLDNLHVLGHRAASGVWQVHILCTFLSFLFKLWLKAYLPIGLNALC